MRGALLAGGVLVRVLGRGAEVGSAPRRHLRVDAEPDAILAAARTFLVPTRGAPALFVDADEALCDAISARAEATGDPFVVVRLARPRWPSPPRWRLPLDLLACEVGDALVADPPSWVTWTDPRHGARVRSCRLDALEQALAEATPEIAWGSVAAIARVLAWSARAAPSRGRPRLLVRSCPVPVAFPALPPHTTLVDLVGVSEVLAAAWAGSLLYEIAHDLPIHAAVAAAASRHGIPRHALRIVSDPSATHALRLAEALAQGREALLRMAQASPASGGAPGTREAHLREAVFVQTGPMTAESDTFVPLSRIEHSLRAAKEAVAEAPPEDRRVVDVALLHDAMGPRRGDWVRPTETLEPEEPYRLRIHVGLPTHASLVEGVPTPIARLLPPSRDGHDLTVAIFPVDFAVSGPRVRALRLPVAGPSEPVSFALIAPARPGPARLRFGIYHQDHLVQAWRVDADVGPGPGRTVAVQDFSRLPDLAGVTSLAPRALSLTLNQGPGDDHVLTAKVGLGAGFARIPETQLAAQVTRYRDLLRSLSVAPDGSARFPATRSAPDATSDAAVRELAVFGSELFVTVFLAAVGQPAMQDAVRALARSAGETVQIARLDAERCFPWAALYDAPLPPDPRTAPVCRGDCGGRCAGSPDPTTICPRGFWGVRHVVEELVVARDPAAPDPTVSAPTGLLVATDGRDAYAVRLPGELCALTGVTGRPWDPVGDPPIEQLLRRDAERPAVFVALGHHEHGANGKRLDVGGGRWLSDRELVRFVLDKWSEPRTVVVLLGCETNAPAAEQRISAANDFLVMFQSFGASAVVGTECPLHGGILARFARALVERLASGAALGEAVRACRAELFASGHPLGLAFVSFGDAGVHVRLGGSP